MEQILDDIREAKKDTTNDWELFVGKKAEYYEKHWENIEKGQKYAFNIGAFFFGIFWMLYRKMYVQHFILLGLLIAEMFLEYGIIELFQLYEYENIISRGVSFAIYAIIGLTGNWVYYNHANKMIEKAKASTTNQAEYEQKLEASGGTNWWLPILALIGYVLLVGAVLFLMFPEDFM